MYLSHSPSIALAPILHSSDYCQRRLTSLAFNLGDLNIAQTHPSSQRRAPMSERRIPSRQVILCVSVMCPSVPLSQLNSMEDSACASVLCRPVRLTYGVLNESGGANINRPNENPVFHCIGLHSFDSFLPTSGAFPIKNIGRYSE